MRTKHLIIFDVCNTVVNTNSTYSYVNFLINKGIKPWYKILFNNMILGYLYYAIHLIFHFDTKIWFVKKYFKGLDVKKIKKLSGEFFKRYESKIFPHIQKIITNKKGKAKIIFLSASINPPIDFLKENFGIDGFSSILEEKNGIYTGRVTQSLWGSKEKIFKDKYFDLKNYEKIDFYTDNHDDINLIKFLYKENKNLRTFIMSYGNKEYRNNLFSTNKINYEFMD